MKDLFNTIINYLGKDFIEVFTITCFLIGILYKTKMPYIFDQTNTTAGIFKFGLELLFLLFLSSILIKMFNSIKEKCRQIKKENKKNEECFNNYRMMQNNANVYGLQLAVISTLVLNGIYKFNCNDVIKLFINDAMKGKRNYPGYQSFSFEDELNSALYSLFRFNILNIVDMNYYEFNKTFFNALVDEKSKIS